MWIYPFSLLGIGIACRHSYRHQGISFHLLFSILYLVTFFAGMPFSWLMARYFDVALPENSVQTQVFATATIGYLCYLFGYLMIGKCYFRWWKREVPPTENSAKATAYLLVAVGLGTLLIFIVLNSGLLLFKLEKYHQIFSSQVSGVALKRFFYFFLVGLVLFFLLKPTQYRWWSLLFIGGGFGLLSYLAVGGTRANLALAVAFFLLLGAKWGYLSARWLGVSAVAGIVAMFGLALFRYRLDLHGSEIWHTFLYLTRDTFSPWENLARILSSEVEYQGLMPIVRDFYVYIPKSLWAERPDIVWNTANYFTKTVLGNHSGLAMSPTLLGSFYIMGGFPMIISGMVVIGGIMRIFDRLWAYGSRYSIVLQAFCLGQLFNLIVLVREGADAFISRWLFFSVVFGLCWGGAVLWMKWRHSG